MSDPAPVTPATSQRPQPTFEIRFIGPGIAPERVPVRTLSEALSAVQRLATGRTAEDSPADDDEATGIGLLRVKRGSAVFQCVARSPAQAIARLRKAGRVLLKPETRFREQCDFILRPSEELSTIARSLNCEIVIRSTDERGKAVLARFHGDTYAQLASVVFVSGETLLYGKVVRVGGAERQRCGLRIPGRRRLLFCDVLSRDASQELGKRLYEWVTVAGEATWIQGSWTLFSFRVREVSQPKQGNLIEALGELRQSGGSAWDSVDDPADFLREIRQ